MCLLNWSTGVGNEFEIIDDKHGIQSKEEKNLYRKVDYGKIILICGFIRVQLGPVPSDMLTKALYVL